MDSSSTMGRVAAPDEGLGLDELGLAARNHGMPLEALRYDLTPPGLHYLLVHYDIPAVDSATWTLDIDGAISSPLRLSLAELRDRPRVTLPVTLECAGNGRARLLPRPVSQPWLVEAVGTAEWTGTPLAPLLREAGLAADAVDVVFTGLDHGVERGVEQDYQRALPVTEAMREEALLAYEMNGSPLPVQHGFPVRLVIPGWYGMAHVKWLHRITVQTAPFDGYQNAVAYRLKESSDDTGEPVTRIKPRALMIPPGHPDFMSRNRFVSPGTHELTGRAWSGQGRVTRVEVSVDSGQSWFDADVDPPMGPWAWSRWRAQWTVATAGQYELLVRATDATGAVQPVDQPWNTQGMANNMTQRVTVFVGDAQ